MPKVGFLQGNETLGTKSSVIQGKLLGLVNTVWKLAAGSNTT